VPGKEAGLQVDDEEQRVVALDEAGTVRHGAAILAVLVPPANVATHICK
jgi:hypothetical protein